MDGWDGIWVGWGIERKVRQSVWCMAAMGSKRHPFRKKSLHKMEPVALLFIANWPYEHGKVASLLWSIFMCLLRYQARWIPKMHRLQDFRADQWKTEKLPLLWCVDIVQQLWVSTRKSVENRNAMIQGALGQRWSSVIPPQIPRRHKRDLVLCRGWGRERKQT